MLNCGFPLPGELHGPPTGPQVPISTRFPCFPPQQATNCFGQDLRAGQIHQLNAFPILGELLNMAPLLPGKTEVMQLGLIFELLGSPNSRIWPGFETLPNVQKFSIPQIPYSSIRHQLPVCCRLSSAN